MLGDISLATNIYVVTGYTDMRKSIDGLCAIVLNQLKEEPEGSSIYMFCGNGKDTSEKFRIFKGLTRFL